MKMFLFIVSFDYNKFKTYYTVIETVDEDMAIELMESRLEKYKYSSYDICKDETIESLKQLGMSETHFGIKVGDWVK